MERVSIFHFQSYRDYLKVASQRHLSRRERPLTLHQWARRLGYRSPRSIAMVLNGQRLPNGEMIRRFSDQFEHSDTEHRYFELMVQLERHQRKGLPVGSLLTRLKDLHPEQEQRVRLEASLFSYLSEWYHLVIKQLVGAPDFKENVAWISRKLRRKVTPAEASSALATMLRLGMLARHARTDKLVVTRARVQTSSDIPDAAIREHHRQMLKRAEEALEELPPSDREMTSLTFRADRSQLAELKADVRAFLDKMDKKYFSEKSSDVFQLNVQCFRHTADSQEGKE